MAGYSAARTPGSSVLRQSHSIYHLTFHDDVMMIVLFQEAMMRTMSILSFIIHLPQLLQWGRGGFVTGQGDVDE